MVSSNRFEEKVYRVSSLGSEEPLRVQPTPSGDTLGAAWDENLSVICLWRSPISVGSLRDVTAGGAINRVTTLYHHTTPCHLPSRANIASARSGESIRLAIPFDPVQLNIPSSSLPVSGMVRVRVRMLLSEAPVMTNLSVLPPLQVQVRSGVGIPNPVHVNVPISLKLLTSSIGVIDTLGGSSKQKIIYSHLLLEDR